MSRIEVDAGTFRRQVTHLLRDLTFFRTTVSKFRAEYPLYLEALEFAVRDGITSPTLASASSRLAPAIALGIYLALGTDSARADFFCTPAPTGLKQVVEEWSREHREDDPDSNYYIVWKTVCQWLSPRNERLLAAIEAIVKRELPNESVDQMLTLFSVGLFLRLAQETQADQGSQTVALCNAAARFTRETPSS